MFLDREEKAMLSGNMGPGVQKAMEILTAKGEAEDAARMVKIVYAHLMPPDTMFFPYGRQGQWARDMISELTAGVTSLKVPTTMEPKFVDLDIARDMEFPPEIIQEMRDIMLPAADYYESLGVIPSYTAMPFIIYPTKFGQHVSIAESIAILWYNTIFGSRCERDDGITSLAAAITGVYPEVGGHLEHNRKGEVLIRPGSNIDTTKFGYAEWDVYGLAASRKCREKIPVFVGLPLDMSFTELKHLLAIVAVESGLPIMHIVGRTPEAPTEEIAFGNKEPFEKFEINKSDLNQAYEMSNTATGTGVDYVMLGCPHVTPAEFKIIADMLSSVKVSPKVKLIVSTNTQYLETATDMGYVAKIRAAGGIVTHSMCIAFSGTQASGNIATDSLKAAFFYSGFASDTRRAVRFGSLEDCIKAAITGQWQGRKLSWM